VGPSDVISITVFDHPDFSGDFSISTDGHIVYPLFGKIAVSGLDVDAIRDKLTGMLQADYIYEPVVNVVVKEFRSHKVTVFGSIGRPGIYYLEKPTRLFDILSNADAISPLLGKVREGQNIRIIRQENSGNQDSQKTKTIPIDAYHLIVEGRESVNIYLQSGDQIYLPTIRQIHVTSGVKAPGVFPYEEGLTVFKAITLAGGPAKGSGIQEAVIRRLKDGKVIEIKVQMADTLQPDDILEVPQSSGEIYVMGEVLNPGTLPYEEGLTVLMAITKAGGATKRASVKNSIIKRINDGKEIKISVTMGDMLQPGDILEVPLSFW
jgi:polysaccharide export outer membrane protein